MRDALRQQELEDGCGVQPSLITSLVRGDGDGPAHHRRRSQGIPRRSPILARPVSVQPAYVLRPNSVGRGTTTAEAGEVCPARKQAGYKRAKTNRPLRATGPKFRIRLARRWRWDVLLANFCKLAYGQSQEDALGTNTQELSRRAIPVVRDTALHCRQTAVAAGDTDRMSRSAKPASEDISGRSCSDVGSCAVNAHCERHRQENFRPSH